MQIKFKKVHELAAVPTYATEGAACFDLYAAAIVNVDSGAVTYDTGLQFEIPENHVMLIYSRSGHGFKQGITLANGTGVIDSDYRGNVMVKLESNQTHASMFPQVGERIAQALVLPYPSVAFLESDELSDTVRGEGGFGSTGVK